VTAFILFLLAAAAVWWWTSNVPVTVSRVEEVTARIAFPVPLRLDSPKHALSQLDRPDEIVIPHQYANLILTFPLSTPATLAITAPISYGFTRAELVRAICDEYDNVYDIEEATAHTKPLPPQFRDNLGRNRTDGLYGIWGHDLSELVCTAVHWTRTADARVTIKPHVEVQEKPKLPTEP
jgi:hypothetical protein